MSLHNLSKLEAYATCKALRDNISIIAKQYFPANEKYRLTDQLIRASRSTSAHIAEGYGRFHFQEAIQYIRIARGSLYEILDHLSVAINEKYLPQNIHDEYIEKTEKCIRILNGYIKF